MNDINSSIERLSQILAEDEQGPLLIDFLVAKIHETFTLTADRMAQMGLMNQDERIALSSAIGDALGTFNKACAEKCSDMAKRSISRETAQSLM